MPMKPMPTRPTRTHFARSPERLAGMGPAVYNRRSAECVEQMGPYVLGCHCWLVQQCSAVALGIAGRSQQMAHGEDIAPDMTHYACLPKIPAI